MSNDYRGGRPPGTVVHGREGSGGVPVTGGGSQPKDITRSTSPRRTDVPRPCAAGGAQGEPMSVSTAGPTAAATTAKLSSSVSLVVPARNEAANIAWVLSRIPDCVGEVILVDGESTDSTLETARAVLPSLRVVPQQGAGKGNALRTGFLAAKGEYIVMIDADGSMSPREIPRYVHFLENGYDYVKGSRFMGGGGSLDITALRRMGNRALLALVNVMYQSTLTDL